MLVICTCMWVRTFRTHLVFLPAIHPRRLTASFGLTQVVNNATRCTSFWLTTCISLHPPYWHVLLLVLIAFTCTLPSLNLALSQHEGESGSIRKPILTPWINIWWKDWSQPLLWMLMSIVLGSSWKPSRIYCNSDFLLYSMTLTWYVTGSLLLVSTWMSLSALSSAGKGSLLPQKFWWMTSN